MSETPTFIYKTGTPSAQKAGINWWKEKEPHSAVSSAVQSLANAQAMRRDNLLRFSRLYSNKDLASFLPGHTSSFSDSRLTFNVCKSCVDTAVAKIAKNKIRPLFLTNQGQFSDQKRAKQLTQYTHGVLEDMDYFSLAQKAFLHSCVYDLGTIKISPDYVRNKVVGEVVSPHEIYVDETECIDGKPRSLFQTKLIARSILVEMAPDAKAKAAVKEASAFRSTSGAMVSLADLVPVIEAWHLPSGPESKDGRHVICVDNYTLVDEEYDAEFFPFVFLRWNETTVGFYGEGIVSQLVGIQIEINIVLQRIKEAMELFAVPRIFLETSSQVTPAQMTNETAAIVYYSGSPPSFSNPPAANPEMYAHLENLVQKAPQQVGLSELSTRSMKPAGLDSMVALREFQDIETERLSMPALRWQKSFVDAAKLITYCSRKLYDKKKDLAITVKGRKFINKIKWKDVDLEDDKFVIDVSATSSLPDRPEGKLQWVTNMLDRQLIDPAAGLDLLDFPDIQAYTNLAKAGVDDIKFVIEEMEEGRYIAPEPFMDLTYGLKTVHQWWLRSRSEGVPDEIRLLAPKWIEEAQGLQAQAIAEQQMSQMQGDLGQQAPPPEAPVA